jgi:hypothetical protein
VNLRIESFYRDVVESRSPHRKEGGQLSVSSTAHAWTRLLPERPAAGSQLCSPAPVVATSPPPRRPNNTHHQTTRKSTHLDIIGSRRSIQTSKLLGSCEQPESDLGPLMRKFTSTDRFIRVLHTRGDKTQC